jgi:hypothetical protein
VKPHLIMTVDYELFGDGSGCLDACVLHPAERMMAIAERFGAPLTFFLEALEFVVIAEESDDRRPQQQMRSALVRGHDVQLHLHPQWTNAARDANGNWALDMARWRIGSLDAAETRLMVSNGKRWIEEKIGSGVSDYRCLAFRAGGWCIQPSLHVVRALRELGFAVDSTVAPGQWRHGSGTWSDFRGAPTLPFWKTVDDVCRPVADGLWELPIACGSIGRIRHLRALAAARRRSDNGLAPGCNGAYRGPRETLLNRLAGKSIRAAQLGEVMLDFSTLPGRELIRITRQWIERHADKLEHPVPVVAIAHTKNFTPSSETAMSEYLEWASRQRLVFSTYGAWLSAVAPRDR